MVLFLYLYRGGEILSTAKNFLNKRNPFQLVELDPLEIARVEDAPRDHANSMKDSCPFSNLSPRSAPLFFLLLCDLEMNRWIFISLFFFFFFILHVNRIWKRVEEGVGEDGGKEGVYINFDSDFFVD